MSESDSHSHRVIDVDAHYLESYEDIAEYMDEPHRSKYLDSGFGESGAKQNASAYFPISTGDRQAHGKIKRDYSNYPDDPEDVENIPAAMEFLGIDAQIMISHQVLATGGINADDEREAQFCKAYIRYMLEEVVSTEDGIYTLAPIPYYDLDAAHEVLDMIEGEEGIIGACMVAAGATPPLGNRKYDTIYERGEQMDLPFVFHTSGSGLDEYVRAGYESFTETHVLGFLESNMSQLVSLVMQGVPVKFPDLDIIVMESGITYIPALMARLDEEYLKRTEEAPLLEKRPSEYLKDIYYGTQPLEVSTDPEFLQKCIEMVGVDSLMYASDYPHWDYDLPESITELPFLSESEKQAILADNAAEVFGL